MKKIFFLLVLAVFSICAQASYSFKHITAADGLPDNQVEGVFFLPDGRLGICTPALISLFDGFRHSMYPYDTRNIYSWTDNGIPLFQYVDSTEKLVWIKDRNALRVFDLQRERFIVNIDSLLLKFNVDFKLTNIFVDEKNRHWFYSKMNGLYIWNNNALNKIPTSVTNEDIISVNSSSEICWLVYGNGIISSYDINNQNVLKKYSDLKGEIVPEDRVVIKPVSGGNLWLMWDRGIAYYDKKKDTWEKMELNLYGSKDVFTAIDVDSKGNAYIGTGHYGMYVVSAQDKKISHYKAIPIVDGTTIRNDITSIAINKKNDDIWIAFLFQGLAYHYAHMNKFDLFNKETLNWNFPIGSVNAFVEMDNGDLLLATSLGLYSFNPEKRLISSPIEELKDKLCLTIYKDKSNQIWVGTLYNGLYKIDKNRVIRHYYSPEISYHVFQRQANYNLIRTIFEDSAGRFWVSVFGGICRFDPDKGSFSLLSEKHPEISNYSLCYDIKEDEHSQLIVASANGLFYYNVEKDFVWRPESDAPQDPRYIHRNSRYTSLLHDSRGLYWFGMQNGLNIVDMNNDSVYYLDKHKGLSNNVIKSIIEDHSGDIWVSTSNGINLIKVLKQNGNYDFEVVSFGKNDGVLSGEYYINSGLLAHDGILYFGGQNGFSAFMPDKITYNQSVNQPIIVGIQIFNTQLKPGKIYNGRIVLNKSLSYTDKIKLKYDENFITIEFSGLNFSNPEQTYYKYKLDGFDKDWIISSEPSALGKAVYTDLPPGRYQFYVYTANNNKYWGKTPAKLEIIVKPPFWSTTLAKIFYVLFFVLFFIFAIKYWNIRNKAKLEELKKKQLLQQREELNQMKFRFFTNVSHEFRTPLTLIITPLEAYIKKLEQGEERDKLIPIYKNALNLLALVNQLLDFRKLEMDGEKLKLINGDIIEFIRQGCNAFVEVAKEKNISFDVDSDRIDELYMYFDRDKIHKIINNLLSNAFKFTPSGGNISVEVRKTEQNNRKYLYLIVSDTGIGIATNDIPHIFDRFYQVQISKSTHSGTGIGLHIIREYIELHDGQISVKSKIGEGTTFSVLIPVDLRPESKKEEIFQPSENVAPENIEGISDVDKYSLLIVEDNDEFREFLNTQLGEIYNVIDAADGEVGEKMAISNNPDIIISDIMMPGIDGVELCKRIKTNLQTSHIPVILLTARTSDESKTQGYEAGADSYISKPFSMDLLLTRIRKLIESRKRRVDTFKKEIVITPSTITITSLDEQLVQKALELVEQNMDDYEYSVDDLSKGLAMSRPTLYRKLQSITGQTPKDFIRSIRLKRAAQLLKDTDLSVSEISYKVGFSTPRYFAKLFRETFGVLPSQYMDKELGETAEER